MERSLDEALVKKMNSNFYNSTHPSTPLFIKPDLETDSKVTIVNRGDEGIEILSYGGASLAKINPKNEHLLLQMLISKHFRFEDREDGMRQANESIEDMNRKHR